jgi:putative restriction endonuclease
VAQNELWSRDELIVAFNLYCKTPFPKISSRNKNIIELSSLIKRSPSSVALKLANFARLDPSLHERHISGMTHGSKGEVSVWGEFASNREELVYQSELILAELKHEPIEISAGITLDNLPKEGKERSALVKVRVNQAFFRKTVLASYDNKCCVTGLSIPELLIASHIVPWVTDKKNRLNPCNGLCLNALHDRAFDLGLITITPEYRIMISKTLKKGNRVNDPYFIPYENTTVTLPQKFLPAREFLEFHNKHIFI